MIDQVLYRSLRRAIRSVADRYEDKVPEANIAEAYAQGAADALAVAFALGQASMPIEHSRLRLHPSIREQGVVA